MCGDCVLRLICVLFGIVRGDLMFFFVFLCGCDVCVGVLCLRWAGFGLLVVEWLFVIVCDVVLRRLWGCFFVFFLS